jgi:hypothetical protein
MLQASFDVAGRALLVCALVGLASSTVFLMLVSFATLRFRLRVAKLSRDRSPRPQPPVSVLKPVHGLEPGLAQCLETFFRQEYQEYELVFAARYRDDGAWSVVNGLRRKFPNVRSKSIETGTGKTVVLSHEIIDHLAVNRSLKASLAHQIRWMRSTRFSRPWGHVGAGLTFAMPFGVLGLATALISGHGALGITLLALAVANRMVQCVVVGWIGLRDRQALWWSWLYPVRDLLGFCVWCASFAGREIVWRGEHYVLGEGGRMQAIPPVPGSAVRRSRVDRIAA